MFVQVLFDSNGCIKRYTSPMEILQEFYTVRLTRYQIRKDYLEGLLAAEALKLENMARFILEMVEKTITVDDISEWWIGFVQKWRPTAR